MKNNRGISFVFVTFLMFTVLALLTTMWTIGTNDITLSKTINDGSKAYYTAEAGIYYGGSIILDAVLSAQEPQPAVTVNNPFSEYKKTHGFVLTITKEGSDYRVLSEGSYNNRTHKVEALVTISGNIISYSQMKKII